MRKVQPRVSPSGIVFWLSASILAVGAEIFFCSTSAPLQSELDAFLIEPTANIPLTSLTIEHIELAVQLLQRIFTLAS